MLQIPPGTKSIILLLEKAQYQLTQPNPVLYKILFIRTAQVSYNIT